jgi:hypothetical protein
MSTAGDKAEPILSSQALTSFRRDGFLLLRRFYDVTEHILPIQLAIRDIVRLMLEDHGLRGACDTFEQAAVDGYRALIALDRALGGQVYDAVKQIPAFVRLVADPRNEQLVSAVRGTSAPGVAGGGFGIRIDNPGEEKYRAPWHQEFPAQLRSVDGLVFWSPLLAIKPEMGPVEICTGSHRAGMIPVDRESDSAGRTGAYALRLQDEEARIAGFQRVAPLTEPGDLLLMDFLTVHRSGSNRSDRPRWTMQFRYFNFRDATGRRIGWAGSFAAGKDFADVMPDLLARER